jgi:signal transduction histidine kinase/CheY-like chemotaxis protein
MARADLFVDSDPMAALMRGVDWGTTSLGPIETWPESLATAVDICMASRFPMAICWGPDLALLYNDAYRPILGAKHPAAIGRPCYEVWSELVPIIKPMFDSVIATGRATWSDDLLLPMERHGYLEEAYFTVSYSAVRGDKRLVAGLFVTVAETTQHVLGHRRLQLSSELARRSSHATGAEEACRLAADVFEEFHADVPASAIYLVEESEARLIATSRVDVQAMRTVIDLAGASPVASVVRGARPEECDASAVLASHPEVGRAIVLPIGRLGQERPSAVLVAGVNPRRELDDGYRDFFRFIARQIGTAITNATAYAEIANARAEAERANTVKDAFLAMLGHELRNPLSPILTALELMTARGAAGLEKERTIIDRQVRHLVRLVDDLLDVSRFTRGKIELHRARVDMADVVADGIETASPLLEQRCQRLEIEAPRAHPFVYGDRARLAQVVANLLTNAAKYTDPKGRIHIAWAEEGRDVVLRVSDSGMGMAPELVPRVFNLFEQGARTIDRAAGGLGLGLAIVKSITSMHGGTVAATSEGPGRGSEFVVRLPLMEPAHEAEASRSQDPGGARCQASTRRVLIVDDNEDGADLLDVALQTMGHTTRVAHDGPEALEAARDFHPDVALIDIGLPVMDGYEVARRLRAMFDGACPKLVAVTGYGQESDRQRAREAGFDRHLVKPVELSRLAELIAPIPA